jgi:hypothetical protein
MPTPLIPDDNGTIVQLSIFTAIVAEKCIPGAVSGIIGLFMGELV